MAQRALKISQRTLEIIQTSLETHEVTLETRWGGPEMLQSGVETGWKALEMRQTVRERGGIRQFVTGPSPASVWLKNAAGNRFCHAGQKRTAIHPSRLAHENQWHHSRKPRPQPLKRLLRKPTPQKPCGMAPALLERRANAKVRCLGRD